MGTTLTNGIYLPNEGEKNCYAGLKTNWETLDQKIADIAALQQAVAGALHREIVESLPTTDIDPNTIYMILSGTSATENVYNEFMYVNNAWELIGTSATDLTNYYTKGDVDGLLLLKANASDLTSHTGDTTIHVTASDKSKWDTVALIKQLRLVNTQVGSSTTIAFANIDDTNGIKVGDKCMDLDAKMFEITAVDTTNQTVTVGTALIDLALDGNVVHTSGDETVGGKKTFANNTMVVGRNTDGSSAIQLVNSDVVGGSANGASGLEVYGSSVSTDNKIGGVTVGEWSNNGGSYANIECNRTVSDVKTSNTIRNLIRNDGSKEFSAGVDNDCKLGHPYFRWSEVYATNYYYGSNNVEFSTKFVTTDTNQTISGDKVWTGTNIFQQNVTYQRTNFYHQVANPCYILKDTELEKGSLASTHTAYPGLWQDKNNNILGYVRFVEYSSGIQTAEFRVSNFIKNGTLDPTGSEVNCTALLVLHPSGEKSLIPELNNDINLGTSTNKWKTLNGVEPSSLSLPSDNINDIIDISSYLSVLDGSTANTYVAPANGWISITMSSCTGIQAYITGLWGHQIVRPTAGGVRFFMPVLKNKTINILIFGGTIDNARFIPCQGNI